MDMGNELLKNGRILALKMIAETYLILKGNKKTAEIFPKNIDINNIELADGDVFVLHNWLMEQYDNCGQSLQKAVEANGEKIVDGKLSNYEIKELVRRADELIVLLKVVKAYKEH